MEPIKLLVAIESQLHRMLLVHTLCSVATPALPAPSWRRQAARIVEELFPCTPSDEWNMLIDLRGQLLGGSDWNRTLDLFLSSRERLEADHYLPFYRLRRLLAASLRLETGVDAQAEISSLGEILRRNPRSVEDVKRALRRELFEHSLDLPAHIPVRVVEQVF